MNPSSPYDIHFRLFGFPVQVQPFFWIVIGLLGVGFNREIENMAIWLVGLGIWIAAAFISILVHELGHAFVFRYVFHVPSSITFHGFGGFTAPLYPPSRRYDFIGTLCYLFLYAAGVLAGFALAAIILFSFYLLLSTQAGAFFASGLDSGTLNVRIIVIHFFEYVAAISIFWGIFNLLPIYPMDGGQISREIFSYFFPRNGVSNSLALSMTFAILLAVIAFQYKELFIAFLFIYFAYQNYQELSFRSFRRW